MTNYYVKNAGSDSNTGLSDGQAWQTISKINSSSFSANDNIYLNKGDTWREELYFPSSGSSGSPITVTSYGSGNDPLILGSSQVSTWEVHDTNIWKATLTSDPKSVWFVNTDTTVNWGTEKGSIGSCTAEYDWRWVSNVLYCYATSDPDSRYTSVEVPSNSHTDCIDIDGRSYVTVDGIECRYARDRLIWARDCTTGYIIFQNCGAHYGGNKNGSTAEGIAIWNSSNCSIIDCTISNAGNHGVYVIATGAGKTVQNNLVEGNTIYDCYHSGIDVMNLGGTHDHTILRYNHVYTTSDYDTNYSLNLIYVTGSLGNMSYVDIYYNLCHDAAGACIQVGYDADYINIYNNVCCRTRSGYAGNGFGIFIGSEATLSNIEVKNNISIDADEWPFRVERDSAITACDNNLWYNSVGSVYVYANSQNYGSGDYVEYNSETGWDDDGYWEDPGFTDKANNDYTLDSGSPCIDEGVDVGLTEDYAGTTVPSGAYPDIGAYEAATFGINIHAILRRR